MSWWNENQYKRANEHSIMPGITQQSAYWMRKMVREVPANFDPPCAHGDREWSCMACVVERADLLRVLIGLVRMNDDIVRAAQPAVYWWNR